jgi:putative flippase GtrA
MSRITTLALKAPALKYVVNSLAATSLDFWSFHLLLSTASWSVVGATFGGNTMGAAISFWLQQRWVFKDAQPVRLRKRLIRFVTGVGLCMVSNMVFVAILADIAGWPAWPARITAACAAWILGFWFNRKVVFRLE